VPSVWQLSPCRGKRGQGGRWRQNAGDLSIDVMTTMSDPANASTFPGPLAYPIAAAPAQRAASMSESVGHRPASALLVYQRIEFAHLGTISGPGVPPAEVSGFWDGGRPPAHSHWQRAGLGWIELDSTKTAPERVSAAHGAVLLACGG
jgi:hypothetical protein